jgi:hypothetical protein
VVSVSGLVRELWFIEGYRVFRGEDAKLLSRKVDLKPHICEKCTPHTTLCGFRINHQAVIEYSLSQCCWRLSLDLKHSHV